MFEVVINDGKALQSIFELLSTHLTEAILKFSKKGLEMSKIDEGRICLIFLKIPASDFDSYKCDKNLSLGLNLDDLVKMMKRLQRGESIKLGYDDANKKLIISMFNEASNKRKRTFKLGLIELSDVELNLKALEDSVFESNEATLPIDYIIEAVKDAEIISQSLTIEFSKDELKMFAAGMIGDAEVILEKDDEGMENFKSPSPGALTLALSYMATFKRASNMTEKVKIQLLESSPLKSTFEFLSKSSIIMFTAPRIEEPENEEEDYDTQY